MSTSERNWLQEISENFGLLFLLERRLAYITDKVLAPNNLTTKQWLVLAATERLSEKPSIQELAAQLCTSHQNVKAIALNLEKSGFISLQKDAKDKRVTRLSTTEKSRAFWQKREGEVKALLLELFKHLSDNEILFLHLTLLKLLHGADELADRLNADTERCDE